MDPNYSIVQPVELGPVRSPALLLKDVYALYGSQFRRWFIITAPMSLLASVILLMADQRIRAIYRSIPRGELQFHWGEVAETGVLRYGSFFISWFLGCFALAAIATVLNHLEGNDYGGVWKGDSSQRAREHFGALLGAACFTFGAFLTGMAVVLFVDVALLRAVAPAHSSGFNYGAVFIGSFISRQHRKLVRNGHSANSLEGNWGFGST